MYSLSPIQKEDKMEELNLKGYTDICSGKMTLKQVNQEIIHYMCYKFPTRLIVDIQRREGGYYTQIWMPIKDFNRRKK